MELRLATLFHGTGTVEAQAIVGPPANVSVSLGGGEFGRGFYTQYSERHALAWAIRVEGALSGPPCVVRVDVNNLSYATLVFLYLNAVTGPALTTMLDNTNQKGTYLDGSCDVIEGPIMGKATRVQQKFESPNAESMLNGPNTVLSIVP